MVLTDATAVTESLLVVVNKLSLQEKDVTDGFDADDASLATPPPLSPDSRRSSTSDSSYASANDIFTTVSWQADSDADYMALILEYSEKDMSEIPEDCWSFAQDDIRAPFEVAPHSYNELEIQWYLETSPESDEETPFSLSHPLVLHDGDEVVAGSLDA
ncbi:hypothetical protein CPB84DRAFT_1142063 [Gymnopilus junonius]|uniref:Uncharacterized protein n=1 Tax=Gymnopilus junonius TaxID=109634 RepID=A0A9P5NNA8_GYMJU|nr:hypothetical protein CPB84DRAFT_1142063 [Gymnopilus junonius]